MLKSNGKKRYYFWDNLKGILIFLVVLGHALMPYMYKYPAAYFLFTSIYIFHMPAFAFISGYFHTRASAKFLNAAKILVIYFIFNSVMMIYAGYIQGLPFRFLEPYYSYWYLLALAVWRLFFKYITLRWWIFGLSIFLSIIAGYWSDIDNTFAISRILGFAPFYILGIQASKIDFYDFMKKYLRKVNSPINYGYAVLSLCILVLVSSFLIINSLQINDLLWLPYDNSKDLVLRIVISLTALFIIAVMLKIVPDRYIPILSEWGRQSLSIFALHRFILFFSAFLLSFVFIKNSFYLITITFAVSLLATMITGNRRVAGYFNKSIDYIMDGIQGEHNHRKKRVVPSLIAFFLLSISIPVITHSHLVALPWKNKVLDHTGKEIIHRVLSADQQTQIKNAVSIAFVGDLILLENQIREAWNEAANDFDFRPVFEYAQKHLNQSDYVIGVLEGPLAGREAGYSTGNYGDGIPLYLNFPDTFAGAIKESGINLVTIANNHLLDKGVDGTMRTIKVLDELSLNHIGGYRSEEEKSSTKIIEVGGLHIAVLAYTFPCNYYNEEYFFNKNRNITSAIVNKNSPFFIAALKQVNKDFENAKAHDPDFIIVLPHMGTQFTHEKDAFQSVWNDIFIQNGADIILSDHSHAVQPIEYHLQGENADSDISVVVNSPGNFVNSYVDYNGDATSIVKIYLDPKKKNIICTGVIPMWTHSPIDSVHRALPVYDIIHEQSLYNTMSRFEMHRIEEVHRLVTSTMLNTEISMHQIEKEYYLFPDGFYRRKSTGLSLTEKQKNSQIYNLLEKSSRARFVGDSITEGSKNGGYGWFEPLAHSVETLQYSVKAWPGATTKTLMRNLKNIYDENVDLYIIAIGANDIRYRNKKTCAMNAVDYIKNIDSIVSYIRSRRTDTQFVFVSPWPSLWYDPLSKIPETEKINLMRKYTTTLGAHCEDEVGLLFIDPTDKITSVLNTQITNKYLVDYIHPNAADGIILYSQAVLD